MFRYGMSDGVKIIFLATILTAFSFWLQGDISIGLLDEGWLWYGTWRTALGEVPVRDFWSYDPGRYYWTAGWSMVFGNGIMGLRASVALFQVMGLTFGLLTLRRIIKSWWFLGAMGALLLVWMYPRCKIFDHCISLTGVYFAVLLIEKPSLFRHFIAGAFLGGAAWFGRNHGLYGVASFFPLILFIWLRIEKSHFLERVLAWGLGIVIGYSPMVFMWVYVAGFFDSIIESIMLLFRLKTTNLPLPVPWPWTGVWVHMNVTEGSAWISTGVLFMILPLFYLLGGLSLIWLKRNALRQKAILISSLFVGVPYAHYAFSRADLSHLALGIFPFLMGVISLPFLLRHRVGKMISGVFLALVFVLSCFSVVVSSPCYQKAVASGGDFVKVDLRGDEVWLDPYMADLFQTLTEINTQKIGAGENLLLAPHWTVFYPLFKRAAPLREIFFLFEAKEERQRQMIAELKEKRVNWVILGDVAFDGREELRFRNMYTLLWRYFMDVFEPVQVEGLPGNYQLLKRKATLVAPEGDQGSWQRDKGTFATGSGMKIGRDGDFMVYTDGIVRDTKTGLEWMAGPDKDTDWYEAMEWVEGLNVAGGGWRMPTVKELEALYRKGAGPGNLPPLLKTTGWTIWSGETKPWSFARYFYFRRRLIGWFYRSSPYHARAFGVRSRKP